VLLTISFIILVSLRATGARVAKREEMAG